MPQYVMTAFAMRGFINAVVKHAVRDYPLHYLAAAVCLAFLLFSLRFQRHCRHVNRHRFIYFFVGLRMASLRWPCAHLFPHALLVN